MARIFGVVLIVLICAWDVDAMRPHILAHSWYTLMLVALFLIAHLADYLTVGRLIYRFDPDYFDPKQLERRAVQPASLFLVQRETQAAPEQTEAAFTSFAETALAAWHRIFAYEPPPSLVPPPAKARLYAFTAAEAEAQHAVGGPVVVQPLYAVVAIEDVTA